jgi:hypothetical protein
MADDTVDPRDLTAGVSSQLPHDRAPGTSLDLSEFETAFAGPDAAGPNVEWAVLWPDGRTLILDSEDAALAVARHNRRVRIIRRFVGPWYQAE